MDPFSPSVRLADQAQAAYTDIGALANQDIQGEAGLAKAAGQFESLFIDWMLKSMREANATLAEGSYLSSSEVEMHQQMLDHQTSIHLSENGGLGLKALIMDQLSGGKLSQEASAAADRPNEPSEAMLPES